MSPRHATISPTPAHPEGGSLSPTSTTASSAAITDSSRLIVVAILGTSQKTENKAR
ncbi:hypothetical protein KW541_19655 [Vibrio fluvialis]|uniref:hypothetical protein n=1 Tax=Vibrio fluvialis TaxID=676 RepID=UPI001C9C2A03|nr:hypothetical protein [Vibrio fluvialis]MBY8211864.1 hypothetical protein [Vibrio fluvialis]